MSKRTKKMVEEFKTKLIDKGIDVSEFEEYFKEIESNLKDKKYGLVWENHTEEIETELLTKFPILKEEKELRIEKEDKEENKLTNNFLIEGDNLESLTALKNMGKKVDVIYIDPPYNTGNRDFVYEDRYVDTEDGFRHSKWLSFMEKRLKLARELMTEDGVIFISIDDNEQANLKLLCDSEFGERNCIANKVWMNNKKGRQTDKNIAGQHEYILMYAKDINKFRIKDAEYRGDNLEREYGMEDEMSKYKRGVELTNTNSKFNIKTRPNLFYSVYYKEDTGEAIAIDEKTLDKNDVNTPNKELIGQGYIRILPRYREGKGYGCWRWGIPKFQKEYKDEIIFETNKEGEYNLYTKLRLDKDGVKLMKHKSVIDITGTGIRNKLNDIIEGTFDFPKPVDLIKKLVSMHPENDVDVLDFFAGSGTTGHAVLELNKEDGGNRNFILCTNNENNICRDITYQRLNKVTNGYTTPKGKEVEGIPSNLTYLKTKLIEKEDDLIDFGVSEELLEGVINNSKVLHRVTKEDTLGGNLVKLESEDRELYLYTNFYIESEDFKKVKESKKPKTIYVSEDNLNDINLNMFDEIRSLSELLVYK